MFNNSCMSLEKIKKIFGSKHTLSNGGVLTAEKCCIKSFMGNLSNAVNAVLNAETQRRIKSDIYQIYPTIVL